MTQKHFEELPTGTQVRLTSTLESLGIRPSLYIKENAIVSLGKSWRDKAIRMVYFAGVTRSFALTARDVEELPEASNASK